MYFWGQSCSTKEKSQLWSFQRVCSLHESSQNVQIGGPLRCLNEGTTIYVSDCGCSSHGVSCATKNSHYIPAEHSDTTLNIHCLHMGKQKKASQARWYSLASVCRCSLSCMDLMLWLLRDTFANGKIAFGNVRVSLLTQKTGVATETFPDTANKNLYRSWKYSKTFIATTDRHLYEGVCVFITCGFYPRRMWQTHLSQRVVLYSEPQGAH